MEIKNGTITTYWNRPVKVKSEITYLNGMLHGTAKFYTSGGWLHQQVEYFEDEVKSSTLFYPNGKIKLFENFEYLERHGLSQCYDQNGNLVVQDKYEQNKLKERIIFRLGVINF